MIRLLGLTFIFVRIEKPKFQMYIYLLTVIEMNVHLNKENNSSVSNSRAQSKVIMLGMNRQEGKGTKSNQKPRRGISRVTAMTQEHKQQMKISHKINDPSPITSSRPRYTSQQQSVYYPPMQMDNTQQLSQHQSNTEFIMQRQSLPKQAIQRMRNMEEEQIVMENQIMELQRKNKEWQFRYQRLLQDKQNREATNEQQRFKSWEEKCWKLEQLLKQKQNLIIKHSQQLRKQIEEQKMRERQFQTTLSENKSTIKYLQSLLKSLEEEKNQFLREISALKAQNDVLNRQLLTVQQKFNTINEQRSIKNNQSRLNEINQEKNEIQEKYRQLMIKNSTADQQKKSLSYQITNLKQQLLQTQQEKNNLEEIVQELERNLTKKTEILAESKLVESKTLHFNRLQLQLKDAITKNEEYRKIINNLEVQRVQQVQYYKEQIRKMREEKHNQQRRNNKFQLESNQYQILKRESLIEVEHVRRENELILCKMTKEYEGLIYELKDKVQNQEKYISQMENKHKVQCQQLYTNNLRLNDDISRIREENDSLISKYQAKYLSRSRERVNEVRQAINSAEENIIKNQQMNKKISQYQIEIYKLEDQVKILSINQEQHQGIMNEAERKVKHYADQVNYYRVEKQKLIKDKVQLAEELKALRSNLISKETMIEKLTVTIKDKSEENRLIGERVDLKNNEMESLSIKIKELEEAKISLKQQMLSVYEENEVLAQRHKSHQKNIQTFKEDIVEKEKLIQKYKECIYLMKRQNLQKQQNIPVTDRLSGQRHALYQQLCKITNVAYIQAEETEFLKSLYKKFYEQMKIIEQHREQKVLQETNKRKDNSQLIYKCREYEELLIKMEQAHKNRLQEVKKDYDILYAKYLKYRNMSIDLKKTHR